MTTITSSLACSPTDTAPTDTAPPVRTRAEVAAPSAPSAARSRRRSIPIAYRLLALVLAVWQSLPPSTSTPSDDAVSGLSQRDRLGERR